jgi:hypothetical protein
MDSEQAKKIDDIGNDLDDLKIDADDVEDNPPAGVRPEAVKSLKHALDEASDAVDELENQLGPDRR